MIQLKTVIPLIWTGSGYRFGQPKRRARSTEKVPGDPGGDPNDPTGPIPDPEPVTPVSIHADYWHESAGEWRRFRNVTMPVGWTMPMRPLVFDAEGNRLPGWEALTYWRLRDGGGFTITNNVLTAFEVASSQRTYIELDLPGGGKLSREFRPTVQPPPQPKVGDGWFANYSDHSLPTTTVTVPGSINATGAVDVTTDFQAWVDSVPNGRRITFPQNAVYRLEFSLKLIEREDLFFDGTGSNAKIICNDPRPFGFNADGSSNSANRNRANIDVIRCKRMCFRGLEIVGANVNGGTSTIAQVTELEAQHGFNVRGGEDIIIENCDIHHIYGDTVYSSSSSGLVKRMKIRDNYLHHTGRQGLALTGCQDVLITGNTIEEIRRGIFDIEPNGTSGAVYRLKFANNTVGSHRLQFLPSGGGPAYLEYIEIVDNTFFNNGYLRCTVATPLYHLGYQRRFWRISRNNAPIKVADNRSIVLENVADFWIEDNHQRGSTSSAKHFIEGTACRLVAQGNLTTGWISENGTTPADCEVVFE
jgi:hypothetical protein